MNKIIVNKLNEVIYHEVLENGLNVYIYKKEGFNKKTACFTTKYGSNNYEFIPINGDKMKEYPKGIAHFLEHKLFESSDNEHTFKKFEKYGAYINAYTNHTETCYYFSTSNYFNECLNLLLDFVQNPHFTDENVEKEKGIIEQEINMTNDRLPYVIYTKTLENALYNNPNRYPVIGDKENVRKITKEDLYDCYNTFYHPSNMILTISGDIVIEETINEIKQNQNKKKYSKAKEIILPSYKEEEKVKTHYEHITKNVSTPRVCVCYKMLIPEMFGEDKFKKECFLNMFFDLKFGSTSNFKEILMEDKIIKSSLNCDFDYFDDTVLFGFQADIINKDEFIKRVEEKLKDDNYDEKVFNLNKKMYLVSMVRAYENPGFIANKIFRDIINYGKFINNAYDLHEELSFIDFVNDAKKLRFDNKLVIDITNNMEE